MGDMASPLLLAVRASLFVDQINHRLLRAAGGVQNHLHGAKEAAAVVAQHRHIIRVNPELQQQRGRALYCRELHVIWPSRDGASQEFGEGLQP